MNNSFVSSLFSCVSYITIVLESFKQNFDTCNLFQSNFFKQQFLMKNSQLNLRLQLVLFSKPLKHQQWSSLPPCSLSFCVSMHHSSHKLLYDIGQLLHAKQQKRQALYKIVAKFVYVFPSTNSFFSIPLKHICSSQTPNAYFGFHHTQGHAC